jgi:hypothetical protein
VSRLLSLVFGGAETTVMSDTEAHRTCELSWLEPWQDDRGCLVLGSDSGRRTSERSLIVGSIEELLAQLRDIGECVYRWCGYWVAVSLGGLEEPALYATAAGDRWHFWYLADGGKVSLRSCGDKAAGGITPVIFSEFDQVPDADLVPGPCGEQVVQEWFESRRLSSAICWHPFE